MASAPFEKQRTDLGRTTPERIKKLTLWQKAFLLGAVTTLGLPGAMCNLGSVPSRPVGNYSSQKPEIMNNISEIGPGEVCKASMNEENFKPTMAIPGKR